MDNTGNKLHYGWVVAFACFVMFSTTYGLTNNTNNLYVVPITQSLGIGRAAFSLMFSMKYVVQCVLTLLFGWFSARLGSRNMMTVGFLLLIGACLVMASAEGLAMIYLGGALMGAGMALASLNVATVLISNWFAAHRGLMIGIIMASTGFGGAIFSPLVGFGISALGWRTTYRVAALALAVVGAALVFAVRERPEDYGLMPVGAVTETTRTPLTAEEDGVMFSQAARTPCFYGCVLLTFLFGVLNNPVHTSMPAHLIDCGFSLSFAALAGGALFFALSFAKVMLGAAYDRMGVRGTTVLCIAANFIALIMLGFLNYAWQAWVIAALLAVSIPIETVTLPILAVSLFGRRDYRSFLGILSASCQMGVAIGNPALNYVYDLFGSYRTGYLFMAAGSVIMLVLFLLVMRRPKDA